MNKDVKNDLKAKIPNTQDLTLQVINRDGKDVLLALGQNHTMDGMKIILNDSVKHIIRSALLTLMNPDHTMIDNDNINTTLGVTLLPNVVGAGAIII